MKPNHPSILKGLGVAKRRAEGAQARAEGGSVVDETTEPQDAPQESGGLPLWQRGLSAARDMAGSLPLLGPVIKASGPVTSLISNELTKEPTNRAEMLPYADLNDGTSGWAMPNMVPATWEAMSALGKASELMFDPSNEAGYTEDEVMPNASRVNYLSGLAATGGVGAGLVGSAAERGANSLGIWGGRLAKTADHKALNMARVMEANGSHRDDIWTKTGWGRNADGKWVFEIDDSGAQYKGTPRSWENTDSVFNKVLGGPWSAPLKEVFDHPELYKAYPQLADTRVDPTNLGAGYYDRKNKRFGLNPVQKQYDPRTVLVHEGDHAVGDIEGFSPGGSYQMFYKTSPLHKHVNIGESGDDAYHRLSGETAARNAQAREDLGAAERLQTPPWLTEDLPRSKQIAMDDSMLSQLLAWDKDLTPEDLMGIMEMNPYAPLKYAPGLPRAATVRTSEPVAPAQRQAASPQPSKSLEDLMRPFDEESRARSARKRSRTLFSNAPKEGAPAVTALAAAEGSAPKPLYGSPSDLAQSNPGINMEGVAGTGTTVGVAPAQDLVQQIMRYVGEPDPEDAYWLLHSAASDGDDAAQHLLVKFDQMNLGDEPWDLLAGNGVPEMPAAAVPKGIPPLTPEQAELAKVAGITTEQAQDLVASKTMAKPDYAADYNTAMANWQAATADISAFAETLPENSMLSSASPWAKTKNAAAAGNKQAAALINKEHQASLAVDAAEKAQLNADKPITIPKQAPQKLQQVIDGVKDSAGVEGANLDNLWASIEDAIADGDNPNAHLWLKEINDAIDKAPLGELLDLAYDHAHPLGSGSSPFFYNANDILTALADEGGPSSYMLMEKIQKAMSKNKAPSANATPLTQAQQQYNASLQQQYDTALKEAADFVGWEDMVADGVMPSAPNFDLIKEFMTDVINDGMDTNGAHAALLSKMQATKSMLDSQKYAPPAPVSATPKPTLAQAQQEYDATLQAAKEFADMDEDMYGGSTPETIAEDIIDFLGEVDDGAAAAMVQKLQAAQANLEKAKQYAPEHETTATPWGQPTEPYEKRIYRGSKSGNRWNPGAETGTLEPRAGMFWGSDDPKVANHYTFVRDIVGSDWQPDSHNPAVLPVDVKFQNPFRVDAKGDHWNSFTYNHPKYGPSTGNTDKLANDARKWGHDGLVIENVRDDGPQATTVVGLKKGTVFSALTGERIYAKGMPVPQSDQSDPDMNDAMIERALRIARGRSNGGDD